jgi:hypothetical protein
MHIQDRLGRKAAKTLLAPMGCCIQDATYPHFEMSRKCKDFVSWGERRFLDSQTCCAMWACLVKSMGFGRGESGQKCQLKHNDLVQLGSDKVLALAGIIAPSLAGLCSKNGASYMCATRI